MARLGGGWRPDGYAPGLLIWLRRKPEGGSLDVPGTLTPALDTRRECIVLVHGFNNHAGEAAEAYHDGFRRRQRENFPNLDGDAIEAILGDTFWPGDADWPWFIDKLDFLVYPSAVHTAKRTGPALADLLTSMPNLERVHFVGHSLGCRVVLEAADVLRRRPRPILGRLCLMAAAVPRRMVGSGGHFESVITSLIQHDGRLQVLHSAKDTVLLLAFPEGQALAGEPSLVALGLKGPPGDMLGLGGFVTDHRVDGAGHGDYWGHSGSAAAKVASQHASEFLGLGGIPRPLGRQRALSESRDVGSPRTVGGDRTM